MSGRLACWPKNGKAFVESHLVAVDFLPNAGAVGGREAARGRLADGHRFGLEFLRLSEFPDLGNDRADVSRCRRGLGHKPGDSATVAGDLNLFAARHAIEELGQMRLRLVGIDGFRDISPCDRLVDFDQSTECCPS